MSDFRKLGNTIIDFEQVRAVIPCLTGVKGLEVWYSERTDCDFIPSETPVETLVQFYEREFSNRVTIPTEDNQP